MLSLFKSKKQKQQELQEEVRNLIKQTKEEEDKARYESNEPWVNVVSERVDPENGVELKLDWNKAFIKYLQAHGIRGRSEDEIVDKWLRTLGQNGPEADTKGFE